MRGVEHYRNRQVWRIEPAIIETVSCMLGPMIDIVISQSLSCGKYIFSCSLCCSRQSREPCNQFLLISFDLLLIDVLRVDACKKHILRSSIRSISNVSSAYICFEAVGVLLLHHSKVDVEVLSYTSVVSSSLSSFSTSASFPNFSTSSASSPCSINQALIL